MGGGRQRGEGNGCVVRYGLASYFYFLWYIAKDVYTHPFYPSCNTPHS